MVVQVEWPSFADNGNLGQDWDIRITRICFQRTRIQATHYFFDVVVEPAMSDLVSRDCVESERITSVASITSEVHCFCQSPAPFRGKGRNVWG